MFWAPCGSGGGGLGVCRWGVLGVPPTHVPMHMHTCTHMHAHAWMVNMIISCKWLPPLGESLGIPYYVIHAHECMHVCACTSMCTCVWAPSHHPHPNPPTPTPRGDPWNQSKFNSTWTNWDILIPFEDLWFVEHPHLWVGGWVGQWVNGWGQVKWLTIE